MKSFYYRMELPDELVDLILSYGDVVVTERYKGVLLQLKYYTKEFKYQQNNPYGLWYECPNFYYIGFTLTKNRIKFCPEKSITNYNPSVQFIEHIIFPLWARVLTGGETLSNHALLRDLLEQTTGLWF